MAKICIIATALFLFISTSKSISQPKYEMRGVWVATLANIDWPSNNTLSTETQKAEIKNILDSCNALKLNAVFLQIRPCADAFYKSETEPWSKYLTGKQDQTPSCGFDPLAYWIEESHKRGIELHAWLNPFRVSNDTIETLSARNIASEHPELIVNYGGKRYLNPGEPAVLQYFKNVVKEIVIKYGVDGIHFDDYFYPYPVKGENYPDSKTFAKYGFGYQTIGDWRRNNVNNIIETISKTIRESNKGIKFGVSPFGIWRNGFLDDQGSDTEGGITNYDDLYADVMEWLKNGWLDYVAPQLYWNFSHDKASYTTLLNWWSTNCYNTPIFVGESLYKINSNDKKWVSKTEMEYHILSSRETEYVKGNIYFSYNHFNRKLYDLKINLKNKLYTYPTIAPYFINQDLPNKSTIAIKRKRRNIVVKTLNRDVNNGELIRYGVYRYDRSNTEFIADNQHLIAISYTSKITLPETNSKEKGRFALTYIAPNGQESELSNIIEIKGR